jgi:multimeric flavodoxin WrbA
MTKLLIIYQSRTGNTEAMAKAVQEGAVSAGASVSLKKAAEATSDDLLNCDAVIFGTPTNFGYMAGAVKEFIDQAYVNLGKQEASKPFAVFACGAASGKPALDSVEHLCEEFSHYVKFKFEKAADGVSSKGRPSPEVLEECKQLGRKMAQS